MKPAPIMEARELYVWEGMDGLEVEEEKHYGGGHDQHRHAGGGGDYGPDIPNHPGTKKLGPEEVRAYHYTSAKNADAIRKDGLKPMEGASNVGSGEPAMVWGYEESSSNFRGIPQNANEVVVEYVVRPDSDTDFFLKPGSGQVAQYSPVPAKDIIAVHEPWHAKYRYMVDEKLTRADIEAVLDVKDGVYDKAAKRLLEDMDKGLVGEKHLSGQHDQGTHGTGTQRFATEASGKAFLESHYSEWRGKLTPAEDRGLTFYQSPGYEQMNGQLRGTVAADKRATEAIKGLDSAISKAPPLKTPTEVYRGFSASQFGKLKPGMTVSDPGYTSTSLTETQAGSFTSRGSQALARITLPAGTRAAGGRVKELVLPRGAKFAVTAVKKTGSKTYVDMEYVP